MCCTMYDKYKCTNLGYESSAQTKDLEYARYAMMMDPLISQALEPAEARAMADEIFEAEKEWLGFYN